MARVATSFRGPGVDEIFGDSGADPPNGRDGKPHDLFDGGLGRDTSAKDGATGSPESRRAGRGTSAAMAGSGRPITP